MKRMEEWMIFMKTVALTKDFYYCGMQDPDLRTFDIIMHTEFGTTYNAYLLKSGGHTVLFETAKLKFCETYLQTIESLTRFEDIEAVIVSHTEPDHVGSLDALLQKNPEIEVVATAGAIQFLGQILNHPFKHRVVKEGDTMTVGEKTLQFMPLPNLHWPDTMYTYIVEDQTLVTCDSFGAHYSFPEGVLRSEVVRESDYLSAAKYYFDNIIGPFKQPFMQAALRRIEGLAIERICTGHGPVLDSHIDEILKLYQTWVQPASFYSGKSVIIAYVSAYGYTKELAGLIADGVREAGVPHVAVYNLEEADAARVQAEIAAADGFLLGSPTILGDALEPVWALTLGMFAATHRGKKAAAFGSYGWSGEAVPNLTARLQQIKCDVAEGFRIRFAASESERAAAQAFGKAFGESVL